MPAIEPHTHQWLNDLAAARLLATGKTKDLPGFGWLTGFVVFTPRRPTMCPVMPCMSNDAFRADAVFAPWLPGLRSFSDSETALTCGAPGNDAAVDGVSRVT